jgi:uncharacterized membrane protein YdjX (TVP38/TMEM64 family)
MAWLTELAHTNWGFAAAIFVLARAMAIIVPPIPGAALDLPAVQIFGWKWAFVLSEAGTMLGALVAFGLSRRLRSSKVGRLVGRLFRIEKVQEWERRLPAGDQFLAWVAIRLPSNAAFDYISYAAGLTNCTVRMFFWSTLIGNVPVVLAFFFLAGLGFQHSPLVGWALPLAFVGLVSIPVTLRLRRKIANLPPDQR